MVESVSLPESPEREPSATIQQSPSFGDLFLRRHWRKVGVAALVLVLLVAGGWTLHWFLTADERLEKSAVERLKGMPGQLLSHYGFAGYGEDEHRNPYMVDTYKPKLWHLQDDRWVAEYCTWRDLKWDYRRTGSKVFPYEATAAVQMRRFVSKPYGSEESATKALSLDPPSTPADMTTEKLTKARELWQDRKTFPEVETSADDLQGERRFPLEPRSAYPITRRPILVAELLFNTKHESPYLPGSCYEAWETKATHFFWDWTEYDKWKQSWDKKGTDQTPRRYNE